MAEIVHPTYIVNNKVPFFSKSSQKQPSPPKTGGEILKIDFRGLKSLYFFNIKVDGHKQTTPFLILTKLNFLAHTIRLEVNQSMIISKITSISLLKLTLFMFLVSQTITSGDVQSTTRFDIRLFKSYTISLIRIKY